MENQKKIITLNTKMGSIKGIDLGDKNAFLGVRYATAERFEYASPVDSFEGTYDATKYGPACIQKRIWYEHLEIPERAFYHKEFREGINFEHSEDCLNLNIFAPKDAKNCPVIIFIHGGGFDSGSNYDTCIDGSYYPNKDIVFVSINYRVAVFGYMSHEAISQKYGHEGNFGLDDQFVAINWVKNHIADFGGNPENITLMGQSAGAISIQYLCLDEKCKGLFQHAIMLSGGGMFPKFALPKMAVDNRAYWQDLMDTAGAKDFEDFKTMDVKTIFDAWENVKSRRKDNMYNTMPVVDGYHLKAPVDQLIKNPNKIDYMIGYTNNDMFAIIMAFIGHKYSRANNGYLWYFDIDAPGDDKNGAFHSSDLRYVFHTLDRSHRPYDNDDAAVSEMMINYICNFAKTGNPNGPSNYSSAVKSRVPAALPNWKSGTFNALHIVRNPSKIKMGHPNKLKLLVNTLTKGDPK